MVAPTPQTPKKNEKPSNGEEPSVERFFKNQKKVVFLMANITKTERKKRETKKSILSVLEENGKDTKPNLYMVDQYMKLYGDLELINVKLAEKFSVTLSQERRQILKSMINISEHLGFAPEKRNDTGNGVPEL